MLFAGHEWTVIDETPSAGPGATLSIGVADAKTPELDFRPAPRRTNRLRIADARAKQLTVYDQPRIKRPLKRLELVERLPAAVAHVNGLARRAAELTLQTGIAAAAKRADAGTRARVNVINPCGSALPGGAMP